MVKDTELEFPKCAERWPVLLDMVKMMEDLPDSAECARPSDMTDSIGSLGIIPQCRGKQNLI